MPHDLGPFQVPATVRALVDDGMVLFAALAADGTIAWMGASSQAVLGRDAPGLRGTSALDLVHPDDHEVVVATLAESARRADDRILAVLRLAHADGRWLTFEFGGIDLRDDDGNGTFLVWGRSYESAGRLLGFLGSLLAGGDDADLYEQVVQWCDALAPHSATVLLQLDADGLLRCVTPDRALPAALATDLVVDPADPRPWAAAFGGGGGRVERPVTDLPASLAAAATEAGITDVWAVPVDGRGPGPDGLLVTWRRRTGPMLATHRRHLEETARLAQLAAAWVRGRTELLAAATTDPLTGAANRSQLEAAVARPGTPLAALLFCDLDDFKGLNDRHGHAVGDRMLQLVSERMAAVLRPTDLLVRLGGDEFAVWCPVLDRAEDAEAIAERILRALVDPVAIDGLEHRASASIGITLVADDDPDAGDLAALLRRADRALYRAKAAGRGRWVGDHPAG